jgi:MoaA/NifB/PqqE/SkfB family radical SAM enzyme
MSGPAGGLNVAKSIVANWRLIRGKPRVNWFLLRYLRKFRVMEAGGRLVLHSHLPPLNSRAYARFIDEHILAPSPGPSHAQIGVTDDCPQNCAYCYNRGRTGVVMETGTILRVIRELKSMGVFWIGLTGGEPLLNSDLVRIVEAIGEDCSSKLFTTGHGLTKDLAAQLKAAGLFYVTVSLDHRDEETHDRIRGYKGAFRTALRAIEILREAGGMHVSVSTVLSGEMLKPENVKDFLAFINRLEVDEAWLSEAKPSLKGRAGVTPVITESERAGLMNLQDACNRLGGMTVNYLGHFEDRTRFGCTAGQKMIYVDPFGEVSPCVFVPMTFGNVREKPLADLYADMRSHFPPSARCFINTNHELLRDHNHGILPLGREDSLAVLRECRFGPLPRFFRLQA